MEKEKPEKLWDPMYFMLHLRDRMFKTFPPPVIYLSVYCCSTASGMFFSQFLSIVHQVFICKQTDHIDTMTEEH